MAEFLSQRLTARLGAVLFVLSGLVNGPDGVLRPGDRAHGLLRAMTPSAVATCERSVYETIAGLGA